MGFLKDAGVTDVVAPDDDYFIANGVYPAVIQDSKLMHPGGDDSKTSWQITYRLDAEVETYGGRYISEFFDMDPNLPDDRKVWMRAFQVAHDFIV